MAFLSLSSHFLNKGGQVCRVAVKYSSIHTLGEQQNGISFRWLSLYLVAQGGVCPVRRQNIWKVRIPMG
jgi:hypothetical protein